MPDDPLFIKPESEPLSYPMLIAICLFKGGLILMGIYRCYYQVKGCGVFLNRY